MERKTGRNNPRLYDIQSEYSVAIQMNHFDNQTSSPQIKALLPLMDEVSARMVKYLKDEQGNIAANGIEAREVYQICHSFRSQQL